VTDLHTRRKKLMKKREEKLIKSAVERKDKPQTRSSKNGSGLPNKQNKGSV
jgi:hypothetical protein